MPDALRPRHLLLLAPVALCAGIGLAQLLAWAAWHLGALWPR